MKTDFFCSEDIPSGGMIFSMSVGMISEYSRVVVRGNKGAIRRRPHHDRSFVEASCHKVYRKQ